jgi:F-box protein 18 (helicase)
MATSNDSQLPFRAGNESSILLKKAVSSTGRQLTDEQRAVVHSTDKSFVARACPGGGKSSTLEEYAVERSRARGLILVYNSNNRVVLNKKLSERGVGNFKAHTFHSLAYREMCRHDSAFPEKLGRNWSSWTLAQRYNIQSSAIAGIALRLLKNFFNSIDSAPSATHLHSDDMIHAISLQRVGAAQVEQAVDIATHAWSDVRDGKMSIPHDAYLKMFVESAVSGEGPYQLPADHILVDEVQDLTAVMLKLIQAQTHATRGYVGDPYQSIYAYRGAIDAMNKVAATAKVFDLTHSFRFPQRIADVANAVLNGLVGANVATVGAGRDTAPPPGAPLALICRTNGQLFTEAAQRNGKGIHWAGDLTESIEVLRDLYRLRTGDRQAIVSPYYVRFESFDALEQYVAATGEVETRALIKLVKDYKSDIPRITEEIEQNAVADQAEAEYIFTTAHKAKGLEWDRVKIGDDFHVCSDTQEQIAHGEEPDQQEVNLLNVAITRARYELTLNSDTQAWLNTERSQQTEVQSSRGG